MRLFNYLILFSALLGIALFAMQNATPVTITFAPGVSVESPLVMELLACCRDWGRPRLAV
jgi:uncharacterized integral membrane protein